MKGLVKIPTFRFTNDQGSIRDVEMICFKDTAPDIKYYDWLEWKRENGRKLLFRRFIGKIKYLFSRVF